MKPYGNCDSCGASLENHPYQRGDLLVCGVCKRTYDKKGFHIPAKSPVHKNGCIQLGVSK